MIQLHFASYGRVSVGPVCEQRRSRGEAGLFPRCCARRDMAHNYPPDLATLKFSMYDERENCWRIDKTLDSLHPRC